MRIMAIDLGDARTGLAVSDAMGILCGEAWTMEEWNMERAAKRIAEAAKERGVERLVLGLPKNMDGSEGVRAEKSRRFKEMLEAECALPVVLWDERRSSIEAHAILHASGKKEKSTAKPWTRSRQALYSRAISGAYKYKFRGKIQWKIFLM